MQIQCGVNFFICICRPLSTTQSTDFVIFMIGGAGTGVGFHRHTNAYASVYAPLVTVPLSYQCLRQRVRPLGYRAP